jgi:NADH-quinone oxidoreductase subunit G
LGSNLNSHPDYEDLKILTNIISVLTKSNRGFLSNRSNEAGAWLSGCVPNKIEGMKNSRNIGLNVFDSINEHLECYIIYNLDFIDFYHYSELKKSLSNAKFVLGISSFITEEDKNLYDVILPLATTFESPGTYVNIEGTWQSFAQSCKPHYMSKEGWKILTKLRLIHGANIDNSLDYLDILNEADQAIRNYKSFIEKEYKDIKMKKDSNENTLIRSGSCNSYYVDNIVRRSSSLNKVNSNKNFVSVNKKTLEQNNIDLSKNKVIVKQGDNTLLAELVIDDNVSDDCIYIANSNKEHYDLGKQHQPIIIENV